ncbi:DUF1642 domain-containing protein [Streptococcus mitis]|uniref:DUF1642 domain-containing protein n=1 Tax=Streptococcus mitis TaxID=28037 RepID=UPI002001A084|nr:DUF1642 domain-containing protein [Streptococcus mitis]
MNKQELIEKYEEYENGLSDFGAKIACQNFLKDLQQLDEPQPVKVPQCVHKYIQEAKEYNWDLQDLMKSIDDEDSKDLQRWFYHECNQETLARAWLDGYEVDEEKRYFVKITAAEQYLVRVEDENFLGFLQSRLRSKFTRKQLEDAGFGWVFDCPGIEIEEVEN